MKAKVPLVAVLALLVSVSAISASALSQDTVTYLLDQYQQTKDEVLEMASYLMSLNSTVAGCKMALDSLNSTIEKADSLAEQAESYLNSSDFVKASVYALRALNTLTPAYMRLSKCISMNLTNVTANATMNRTSMMNRTRMVNATMNCTYGNPAAFAKRAEVLLERLERILERAKASGANTSELEAKIDQLMEEIKSINSTDPCEAMKLLTEIRSELTAIMSEYNSLGKAVRHGPSHLNHTAGEHGNPTNGSVRGTSTGRHSGEKHSDKGHHSGEGHRAGEGHRGGRKD